MQTPQTGPPNGSENQNTIAQTLFSKLIQEINQRLVQGLEYERILDFVFESLDVVIPYDRIGIALLNETGNVLRLEWLRSKVSVQHLHLDYSAPIKGSSLKKIIETGEPRIINDLSQYAVDHPNSESTRLALQDGIRSSLTCPLRANNKAVGVVFFSSCEPQTYSQTHIGTFLAIADELSVIVEQGRLKHYFTENALKSQTLKMVLHDLKSPLAVMLGFIDSSYEEEWYQDLHGDIKEVFSVLKKNTLHMQSLISYLEELIQASTKVSRAELQRVDLIAFCSELINYARILGEKKDISFDLSLDQSLPDSALLSPQKIRRALENLFTNAIKFSFRGTRVTVRVTPDRDRLVFAVSDRGQGIPENEISNIFREFVKTSVRPTEGEPSTGLGLAIVKKIVERFGGQIMVSSKFGEGSTFTFWIPGALTVPQLH